MLTLFHPNEARLKKRRQLLQRLRSLLIEPLEGRIATGSLIPIPLAMISEALDNARYPIPTQATIEPPATTSSSHQPAPSPSESPSALPAWNRSALDPKASIQNPSSNPPSRLGASEQPPTTNPTWSTNPTLINDGLLDSNSRADPALDSTSHPIASSDGGSSSPGGGSSGSGDRMTVPQSLSGAPVADVPRPDLQATGGGSPNPSSSRTSDNPSQNTAPRAADTTTAASTSPSTFGVGIESDSDSSSAGAFALKSTDQPALQQAPPGKTILLNDLPASQWRFREYGGQGLDAGREQHPRWIVEGNSFISQLELDWSRPADVDRVEVRFRTKWDSDARSISDAFEIAWLDAGDRSLVPIIQQGRDSFFNLSEGESPQVGSTASIDLKPFG
ncbi:MAG: hypothetical protein ACK5PZ_20200, partial [Pirellula sp.]